jgi:pullulanase/glycogen debranching enzyme
MSPRPRLRAGSPYPHGASFEGDGVNFALFSANAEKVEPCLFDATGARELERCLLSFNADSGPFEFVLPGAGPGQVWRPVIDKARSEGALNRDETAPSAVVTLKARSLVVLEGNPA